MAGQKALGDRLGLGGCKTWHAMQDMEQGGQAELFVLERFGEGFTGIGQDAADVNIWITGQDVFSCCGEGMLAEVD
ncbi:hypothetical protein HZS61_005596 [Fusarium oxysporum f. sp. conglutinans]|uniref:Uncharacterized protein n=2 Tax=Fusarium oxysporum f. sp. conglutinans TaxID=100902 RepID=A0A8H6GAX6_FUSOX|nr:hypothetical protein HZS61_005596 [Fusarium oxysporum f. sp. conglutinans]